MRAKRYSAEQIVAKLREAEKLEAQALTIPQSSNRLGISDQTFYRWRIKYCALKEDEGPTLETLAPSVTMDRMTGSPDVRSRWERWVRQSLGGSESQIQAATEAAMEAISARRDQGDVASAARSAWVVAAPAQTSAAQVAPASSPPAPTAVFTPPRRESVGTPSTRGRFRGRVAGFQQRNEMSGRRYLSVWNFRVESRDQNAEPLTPVSVEMRGYSFEGALANGDEIEIVGRPKSRRVLHVRAVDNLTSNSVVRVTQGPPGGFLRALGTGAKFLFLLLFLAIFATIAYTILKSTGKF